MLAALSAYTHTNSQQHNGTSSNLLSVVRSRSFGEKNKSTLTKVDSAKAKQGLQKCVTARSIDRTLQECIEA